MVASLYGGLVDVRKTYLILQLKSKKGTSEMFIPLELVRYFVDVSNISNITEQSEGDGLMDGLKS
jgi:hypothetical protein